MGRRVIFARGGAAVEAVTVETNGRSLSPRDEVSLCFDWLRKREHGTLVADIHSMSTGWRLPADLPCRVEFDSSVPDDEVYHPFRVQALARCARPYNAQRQGESA